MRHVTHRHRVPRLAVTIVVIVGLAVLAATDGGATPRVRGFDGTTDRTANPWWSDQAARR
jgi:hypothetical protein